MSYRCVRPEGVVERVAPRAVYEDEVFTQLVVARLTTGVELTLFDGEMRVSQGMIGKTTRVHVRAFLSHISRLAEAKRGIEHLSTPKGDSVVFSGQVIHVNTWCFGATSNGGRLDVSAWIDIGYGCIEVESTVWTNDPNAEFGGRALGVGDFVRVQPTRLDLREIVLG